MSAQVYIGPRYGADALPERDNTAVTTAPCKCPTCVDLSAWLVEPMVTITFVSDGVSIGHRPARWVRAGSSV